MAVTFELQDLDLRPEQEPILTEMIHAVKKRSLMSFLLKVIV